MAKSKPVESSNGEAVNRSQAIREALTEFPKASSKEIVGKLAERGIRVAPTLVYYVKSKRNQAKRKKRRADAAAMSASTKVKNPVELVLRVKEMAREVGGIKYLKQLVDLLAD
jgi:uroporphyrinogen-III synthase